MQLPIGFGDGIGVQQPVGARLRRALRGAAAQPFPVDATIDDYTEVPYGG
jgi:hypothetical protein